MDAERRVGNYLIEEPIGRGGMGIVYHGRHTTLPREVAIKSINARGMHDLRRLRSRFEREAFIQSQLDHPAIVKVYDYIVSEQTYYIVMEYVEGRSLQQVLTPGQPLPLKRAFSLFEQILAAIAYAHTFVYRDEKGTSHRGIVHRDLKPANILVTRGDRIKITDFGIVKLVGADTTDTSSGAYGSPLYVSPEQAEGTSVDQRSDIYSLGVILYEMLTGTPPFGGRDAESDARKRTEILRAHLERQPRAPSELNPLVTPDVERVIFRALEKKPERRYASAADFLHALAQARGGLPDDARQADAAGFSPASHTAAAGAQTESILRDSYHTQPIRRQKCDVCGAEASAHQDVCAACGHDLDTSPATAELTRREIKMRQTGRGIQLAVACLVVASLGIAGIYFMRRDAHGSRNGAGGPAHEAESAAPVSQSSSAPPAKVQSASSINTGPIIQLSPRVRVDSSYDGYNVEPLTDGLTDVRRVGAMRYNKANWVSEESPEPHWIELSFERQSRVTTVYIFWGFDRGRYMPSRTVELQAADASGDWHTVSRLEPAENFDRTAFEFKPFDAMRLRILQPAQQGPPHRPFVMWVREVQVFGTPGAPP